MFHNIYCSVPEDVPRLQDQNNNLFIQMVLEEDRRVKELHAQEIQLTAENPRIRAQHETTDISAELKAQKHDNIIEEKRRQQLRQDNLELRQLQIQLRSALVSKQLVDQKTAVDREKEALIQKKRNDDKEYEAERLRCQEALREIELKERRKKENFRGVLQSQIAEIRERRRQEHEEVLKDREEMQKMLQHIKKEQEQERLELERRKSIAKNEMDEFNRAREEYKKKQLIDSKDEYEKFLEMMEKRDREQRQAKEEKQRLREQKTALSEKIGQQLFEIEKAKRRRENLLLDLLMEERNTNEDERFKQNLQKQFTNRIQMKMELERYHVEVQSKKEERKRREIDVYRAQQQRQQDEDQKETDAKEEKKRVKLRDHGKVIIQMIEEKRQLRALAAAEELQQHEFLQNEERKKQELVEDERLRILKSVPVDVLRYLPYGVVRESDRVALGIQTKEKQ